MAISVITIPTDKVLSRNPVRFETLSTGHSALDNYRVVVRILFEKTYLSATFDQVAEVECIPDSAGICRFDFQKTLHAELHRNHTLRIPDIEDQHPFPLNSTRRFKIEYLEKYGDPQVEQTSTTSSIVSILLGGVDMHYFGLNDFFENIEDTNAILSYWPDGKRIARNQPEYLNFLQHEEGVVSYNRQFLKVKQYDITNTLTSTTDHFRTYTGTDDDALTLRRWNAGAFPVSPEKLALNAATVKYTVQVWGVSTIAQPEGESEQGSPIALSQEVTYYIDDEYQHRPTDVIWFGSFANPHILRCTGEKSTQLDITRYMSELVFTNNADPRQLASRQHSKESNQSYTYRTGSLTEDEKATLQEMLEENNLFEYAYDTNYYRLELTGKRYDLIRHRRTPETLEFAAKRAFPARNYMRLLPSTAAPGTTGRWQITDNGYWQLNTGSGYWLLN